MTRIEGRGKTRRREREECDGSRGVRRGVKVKGKEGGRNKKWGRLRMRDAEEGE